MLIKKLKTIAAVACMTICSLPMMGQDLLARQAPVDKKMRAVDSVALQRLIIQEQYDSPAADLYDEWENRYAHKATELPDSFRIDLRDSCMPTDNRVVTSNFGARWGRQHKGIDVKVYIGDTIRSAFSGKVRIVNYERKGYGKYVVIRHYNGLETIYGHMSKHLVMENDEVKAGDPIGLGGNTGRSTGSHLHFETRLCGGALNPAIMFDFRNQDVVDNFYTFHRDTYEFESIAANRLRGVGGTGSFADDAEERQMVRNTSKKTNSSSVSFHKVSRGETLSSIARKRGTTINELCRLNRITKKTKLKPGQILKYN